MILTYVPYFRSRSPTVRDVGVMWSLFSLRQTLPPSLPPSLWIVLVYMCTTYIYITVHLIYTHPFVVCNLSTRVIRVMQCSSSSSCSNCVTILYYIDIRVYYIILSCQLRVLTWHLTLSVDVHCALCTGKWDDGNGTGSYYRFLELFKNFEVVR